MHRLRLNSYSGSGCMKTCRSCQPKKVKADKRNYPNFWRAVSGLSERSSLGCAHRPTQLEAADKNNLTFVYGGF